MKTVTLISDFGLADPYVASMKGAILSRAGACQMIDITHSIGPQDIAAAHFILGRVWNRFPKGTVHLAVVDPGVGTGRRRIVVRAGGHFFVGPDNGLLGFTARIKNAAFWEIRDSFAGSEISATFEGRDVFAPAAGEIASGTSLRKIAKPIPSIRNIQMPVPAARKNGLSGEIVCIDQFGNLISNLQELPPEASIRFGGKKLPVLRTYADVPPGKTAALRNSFGLVEIAVRNGSAMKMFRARKGQKVTAVW